MWKIMISPILIFWPVKGWVKSAKNSPKWKVKINLSCATLQEQYSIWSWFLVHLCKMMITPGIFSIFQNFDFLCCWWGKSAKNGPKWQKILSVVLHISGTIYHIIVIDATLVWNDYNSKLFFCFIKILVSWVVVGGVKGQKIVQNDKKFCLPCSMSQESGIVWLSFSVHKCKTMISPQFFKLWFLRLLVG